MKPYHFYVAFNPLFNTGSGWQTQAHEFHHRLKEKKDTFPSSHLYWGKLQISEYSEPLNISEYQEVLKENQELQMHTHLYVTDFQHLWVGKVTEALREIPDPENTLPFYQDRKVEVWFKITDFDLLSNNAEETLLKLAQLHVDNEHYSFKIKEFTPFTSGIRYPVIIQDRSLERYFEGQALRVKQENPLIHAKGEHLKIGTISQSFVIPEENFKKIPEYIRNQVIQAEILLVEAQSHGTKDRVKLEQAVLTYLKCLEYLLNETIVGVVRREEGHRVYVSRDGAEPRFIRTGIDKDRKTLIQLKDCKEHFSLSQIKMLMDTPTFFSHTNLDHVFRHKKKFWEYCRLQLRPTLKNESFLELRQSLCSPTGTKAHERELLLVRNLLLGVGGQGIFNDLIESYFDLTTVNTKTVA